MYTFDVLGYATNGKFNVYETAETILVICHGLDNGALVALDHSEYVSPSDIRNYVNSLGASNDDVITLAVCYPESVLSANWNELENNMIAIPFNWNTKTRFQVQNNQVTIWEV